MTKVIRDQTHIQVYYPALMEQGNRSVGKYIYDVSTFVGTFEEVIESYKYRNIRKRASESLIHTIILVVCRTKMRQAEKRYIVDTIQN